MQWHKVCCNIVSRIWGFYSESRNDELSIVKGDPKSQVAAKVRLFWNEDHSFEMVSNYAFYIQIDIS